MPILFQKIHSMASQVSNTKTKTIGFKPFEYLNTEKINMQGIRMLMRKAFPIPQSGKTTGCTK